ncbi:MAG: adenine deaminase [Deltaproteobacteria bacterium]|nr:adenine deaminase [Deltaproteobacteria bacterium]
MRETISRISGNIVDVVERKVYPGTIEIRDGKISRIIGEHTNCSTYLIPGFIDSHVHVESSMLTPSEFARVAVTHGTVGAVCDPHEIANVMGIDGIRYMITDGNSVPFKFYWGASSCVPATPFETAGARIDTDEVQALLKIDNVRCLSEMMNFPGVLGDDPTVMGKIDLAKLHKKVIDGHAPGLKGRELEKYISSGISTDHECFSKSEALEKIRFGMKIQIREGSAAKNFDALIPISKKHPNTCMFCSDDKHPEDLVVGHINAMVKKAIHYGVDTIDVLRMASLNPIRHYGLDVGLLQVGDPADFLVIDNLRDLTILKTFINGDIVAKDGKTLIKESNKKIANNFNTTEKEVNDFAIKNQNRNIHIIEAIDGELITNKILDKAKVINNYIVSDTKRDILKIVVINRYKDLSPSIGFVKNFGLKKGAIGSSIAHDSHNIISVGVNDIDICRAVNIIITNRGGLSAVCGETEKILPLPIAGIMSDLNYIEVSKKYIGLNRFAKEMGSQLRAPFMTLSFMGLLVIPEIKLSDKGLFDVSKFEFMDLFASP